MNVKALMEEIEGNYSSKMAQAQDGAAYAYVKSVMDYIAFQGLNPLEYEVLLVQDGISFDEDGATIKSRIRISRIKDQK